MNARIIRIQKKKLHIYVVHWLDAGFSLKKNVPTSRPLPHVSVGILIEKNKQFLHLANNVKLDSSNEALVCVDGVFIPVGTVLFKKKLADHYL